MSNDTSTRRAEHLQEAVRRLSAQDLRVLQKRLGQTAVTQAQLGVRQGRDPYGKPWAPLTSRTGQPLRRTGNNIQRSWTASGETTTSFQFGSRFKYLATHQYGAIIRPKYAKALRFWVEGANASQSFRVGRVRVKKGQATQMNLVFAQKVTIPRRQMVPEQNTGGLSKIWFRAFSRTTRLFLEERLRNQSTGTD